MPGSRPCADQRGFLLSLVGARAAARHLALEGDCVLLDALDSGTLEAIQETAASLIK